MLLWRKIKWTARQVKMLHDSNSELAALATQTATVYFTLDAVKKWSAFMKVIYTPRCPDLKPRRQAPRPPGPGGLIQIRVTMTVLIADRA